MNPPDPLSDAAESLRTDFVGFASFTVLVYDHFLTFGDEVRYIWRGKKGPIVYLFFLNRYITPLSFIVNLYAYLAPTWTVERCGRFIRYEGTTVAFAIEVVGLMMSLRIRALYPRQPSITYFLWFLLLVETGLNAWLITGGRAVPHNPDSGVHSCTFIFDPEFSAIATSSAWFPLMYDSIVFSLTLYRTWPSIRRKEAGFILRRLFEDGLLYYSVIFSVTLVLTIMIIAAPPGLKNITAQLEQLITVAMMSRITLNLRKAGRHSETEILAYGPDALFFRRRLWWDNDSYVQTHVSTHVSVAHSNARGGDGGINRDRNSLDSSFASGVPDTPPDAVVRGTDLRFANDNMSHGGSALFPRGHEEYEMDNIHWRGR